MASEKEQIDSISDISETLLLPLYARARETQSKYPLLNDKKAVEITQTLNAIFATSDSPLHRRLLKGKIRRTSNEKLIVFLSLRTRRFDRYCEEFLRRCPDGVIVELGCGLSSRFSRIDNGRVDWYDLDLPEVIAIRRRFFQDSERCHMIASSVLDFQWLEQLASTKKEFLFIAEGLLMYLQKHEVQSLILQLQQQFPGCELVCEVVNDFVIKALQKKRWQKKFQRDNYLGSGVTMRFGIRNGAELESWKKGIHFMDEWTIFDDHEKKLGWMNLFSFSKKLRKAQWIVHYQLQ